MAHFNQPVRALAADAVSGSSRTASALLSNCSCVDSLFAAAVTTHNRWNDSQTKYQFCRRFSLMLELGG